MLVLSHHLESRYAMRLLEEVPERAGYLLKERVSDVAVLVDALTAHRRGRVRGRPDDRLAPRRPQAPSAGRSTSSPTANARSSRSIAEGHSNSAIGERLFLSRKTIETHITQIFSSSTSRESPDHHRRVLAVLTFLRAR